MSDADSDVHPEPDPRPIEDVDIDHGFVTQDAYQSMVQQGCPECGTQQMHQCGECHPSSPGTYTPPLIVAYGSGVIDGERSCLTASRCGNCGWTIGVYLPLSELEN